MAVVRLLLQVFLYLLVNRFLKIIMIFVFPRYIETPSNNCSTKRTELFFSRLGLSNQIERDERGKPFFKNFRLKFNISYSAEYVSFAIGNVQCGTDIEKHDQSNLGLECFFMNPGELEQYKKTSLLEEYFQSFSRKEGYVKYDGSGISYRLKNVDICAPNTITVDSCGRLSSITPVGYSLSLSCERISLMIQNRLSERELEKYVAVIKGLMKVGRKLWRLFVV
jgi:hypothetical protein